MSVEVEIYLSNLIKFFKQNPNDLLNLVPKDKEEDFYVKIREIAFQNVESGKDAALTQKQLIEICRELNTTKKEIKIDFPHFMTKFGPICLN